MAEVMIEFEDVLTGSNGKAYEARACGRHRADGLWEGWLEFVPKDGSEVLQTGRETTQPQHDDLLYWASGLTIGYLDGALLRVLRPAAPVRRRAGTTTRPAYTEPAGGEGARATAAVPQAVLDPYAVYAQGADILRSQLMALDEGQLRNIIRTFELARGGIAALSRTDLIALIMGSVEHKL